MVACKSMRGVKLAVGIVVVAFLHIVDAAALESDPKVDFRSKTRISVENDDIATDVDGYQYIDIYVRDLIAEHMNLRLHGAMDFDFNNDDPIDDVYEDSWPRISEGYLDLYDYGVLSRLRVGRQVLRDVDYLHYDGFYARFLDDRPIGLFIMGGRPVSYYSNNGDDWLGGGGVILRPSKHTELQLDTYRISDQENELQASAIRLEQLYPGGIGDYIETRWIDSDLRDVLAELRYYNKKHSCRLWSEIYWQPERLGDDNETYDALWFSPLATVLGPAEEEIAFSLNAEKTLNDHYILSAGGKYRRIMDRELEGGENFTNVDSRYCYLGLNISDLPTTGLEFDFFANYFNNPEEIYYDLTAEAGYQFSKQIRASVGVTHSEYDFNAHEYFQDVFGGYPESVYGPDETTARIYFVEAKWKINKQWKVSLKANYEDSDGNDSGAYEVRLGLSCHLRNY